MRIDNPQLSGSIIITGSTAVTGDIVQSGDLTVNGDLSVNGATTLVGLSVDTASYSVFAVTASYAVSASHEITYELSSSYAENATSASYALTASFALNAGGGAGAGFPFSGSADITGSLYVSGGIISGSFVGDGSQLTNVALTEQATVVDTFSVTGSHTTTHNFGTKNVLVQVYDNNDNIISPSNIKTLDVNTVKVSFSTSETGRVVIAKGGHVVDGVAVNAASAVTASNADLSSTVHNNYLLSGSIKFWSGPKTAYDAISSSADPDTIYFTTE